MIISNEAADDLGEMAYYIATLYRPESGHNYVNRILGKLASLQYTADIFQYTKFSNVRRIHPLAKTIPIMNGKWIVVFHFIAFKKLIFINVFCIKKFCTFAVRNFSRENSVKTHK